MPIDSETILERLVRMEEKLDGFLHRQTSIESRTDSHDLRLRILEQGQSKVYAIAGLIALGISSFGSTLIDKIVH